MKLIDDDGKEYEVINGKRISPESGTYYGNHYTHVMTLRCADDDFCFAHLHLKEIGEEALSAEHGGVVVTGSVRGLLEEVKLLKKALGPILSCDVDGESANAIQERIWECQRIMKEAAK